MVISFCGDRAMARPAIYEASKQPTTTPWFLIDDVVAAVRVHMHVGRYRQALLQSRSTYPARRQRTAFVPLAIVAL